MRSVCLTLLLAALPCCGPDTGIPQPDPIPRPALIRTTGGASTPQPVDVVGLPSAVAGSGRVSIRSRSAEVSVEATAAGSFAAVLRAQTGELLQIRYRSSEAAEVLVRRPIMTLVNPGPDPFMTTAPITSPRNGVVTVSGKAGPNADLLAVDFSSGASVPGKAGPAGTFSIDIPAAVGDEVRVYALGEPLSPPWVQTVPP